MTEGESVRREEQWESLVLGDIARVLEARYLVKRRSGEDEATDASLAELVAVRDLLSPYLAGQRRGGGRWCRQGHLLLGKNLSVHYDARGWRRRRCRTCMSLASKRYRDKKARDYDAKSNQAVPGGGVR